MLTLLYQSTNLKPLINLVNMQVSAEFYIKKKKKKKKRKKQHIYNVKSVSCGLLYSELSLVTDDSSCTIQCILGRMYIYL